MIERKGDIWTYDDVERKDGQSWPWIVIPTNGETKVNGEAVMGAGVAKDAAVRFPLLARKLGAKLREGGNHVFFLEQTAVKGETRLFRGLVAFPTKHKWRDMSSLELIEQSAKELRDLVLHCKPAAVILPRVGTGLGGLGWKVVKPVLERHLTEDLYVVMEKG